MVLDPHAHLQLIPLEPTSARPHRRRRGEAEGARMFDQLVNDAASLFNVPAASVRSYSGVAGAHGERANGWSDGFLDLFRRVGLSDVIYVVV